MRDTRRRKFDPEREKAKVRAAYQDKLHPALLEAVAAYKELAQARDALGKNPPAELIEKIRLKAESRFTAVLAKLPAKVQIRAGEIFWLGSDGSESEGLLCWLCLMRYGKPLWKLICEQQAGDPDSSGHWRDLCKEWEAIANNRKPFPSSFKSFLDHRQIFMMGVSLGLLDLTQRELAQFFDDFCPYCNDVHDPNAMSKQRAKFGSDLQSWEPSNDEEMAIYKGLVATLTATPTDSGPAR